MMGLGRLREIAPALAVLSLLCSGCIAGIRAGEVVPSQKPDDQPDGLRYFLPAQYFVIEQKADGQWDAHFQQVVNRSREFYLQPYAYFASGKTTVLFHPDGTLKSVKLDADATAVPEEGLKALKEIQLKREELRRAEIDAKAKGGFPAEKQVIEKADGEARAVFLFRIDGDKLVGDPKRSIASVALQTTGAGPAPEQSGPQPITPGLAIKPSSQDPKAEIELAVAGRALTRSADGPKLKFFIDVASNRLVSDGQRKAILDNAKEDSGKLVLRRADVKGVSAIELAP